MVFLSKYGNVCAVYKYIIQYFAVLSKIGYLPMILEEFRYTALYAFFAHHLRIYQRKHGACC